jgi:hypothetical protein
VADRHKFPAADPKRAMRKAAETQKKSESMAEILTSEESSDEEDWELWHKSAKPRRGRKVNQGRLANNSSDDD